MKSVSMIIMVMTCYQRVKLNSLVQGMITTVSTLDRKLETAQSAMHLQILFVLELMQDAFVK